MHLSLRAVTHVLILSSYGVWFGALASVLLTVFLKTAALNVHAGAFLLGLLFVYGTSRQSQPHAGPWSPQHRSVLLVSLLLFVPLYFLGGSIVAAMLDFLNSVGTD